MKNFRDFESKFIKRDELKNFLSRDKRKPKSLVLANGCFDILHIGHINYLKEAKENGDILIVAINSDLSVKKLKGEKRPIMLEMERAKIVSCLYFVDFVTIFDEENVNYIIEEIKPDVHCKGSDYKEENVPEREAVYKNGGIVKIVGGEKLISTTDLISKISQ